MASRNVDDIETVLADLELTRGLTIQMTAIGTLGMIVAWAVFSTLYQVAIGHVARFQFAPPGIGWWTDALNVLVIVILGTAFIIPHEWLHGLAIRYYGGEARYGVGIAHFILSYAYAMTDHGFSRNRFLVDFLTPLITASITVVYSYYLSVQLERGSEPDTTE